MRESVIAAPSRGVAQSDIGEGEQEQSAHRRQPKQVGHLVLLIGCQLRAGSGTRLKSPGPTSANAQPNHQHSTASAALA